MPRPDHRLYAGPYSALRAKLFETVRELQRSDPLRRLEIVVASNLLGIDLRRDLVQTARDRNEPASCANIRFLTLLDLARDAVGETPGEPAPPMLLFASVAAAIPELAEMAVFGEVRHRIGFSRAAEATLRDLRDAGVAPEAFADWSAKQEDPDRRGRLGALAALYCEVSRRMERFADPAALLRQAAEKAPSKPVTEPLLLYGFYDMTGLQRDLVAAVARVRPIFAWVPSFEEDLGEFGQPLLTELMKILQCFCEPLSPPVAGMTRDAWIRRLARRGQGEPLADDGSLALVSCADDTDEAREVAREIVAAHEEGILPPRTAILLRDEAADGPRILSELARAGVPAFRRTGPSLLERPVGRALAIWLRLEEEGFRRDDVLELLELFEAAGGERTHPFFRPLARDADIVRGIADWDAATKRLRTAAASADGNEGDPEKHAPSLCRRAEARPAVELLDDRWKAVRDSASNWGEQTRRCRDWSGEFARRLAPFFGGGHLPEELAAAIDAMESLGEGAVSRAVASEILLSIIGRQGKPGGQLGRDGVAIVSVMDARGVGFDHVLLPGLVEKKFPQRARPDPLLSDEERESLALHAGRPLGPKVARRPEEERFLFAGCADAARKRLTILAARRDSALDRDRTPSELFSRAVDAMAGRLVETRDYLRESPPGLRATRLGVPEERGPATSECEARLRILSRFGIDTVAAAYEPLQRARRRAHLRALPVYTRFEGRIRNEKLLASLAARERECPLSASSIEAFARCGYRYFFKRILGLRAIEETAERGEVDDLARGALLHDAARRIAWAIRGRTFSTLSDEEAEALISHHAEEALADFEERSGYPLAPRLLRNLAAARLAAELAAWLRFERRGFADWACAGSEARFGPGGPDAAAESEDSALSSDAPAQAGETVLRGRIDLLLRHQRTSGIRVTDFKAPRSLQRAKKIRKLREAGSLLFKGELSQLAVYVLAVRGPLAATLAPGPVSANYLYLAPDKSGGEIQAYPVTFDPEDTGGMAPGLSRLLEIVNTATAAGAFPARVKSRLGSDNCTFCDYASICGPGKNRRYEAKGVGDRDPAIRSVDRLEEIE
jgi:PD-(D/E)XK nuclease superfamily